jgi:ABC-type dipeptide/oligopeptide/nickel transport system permease component
MSGLTANNLAFVCGVGAVTRTRNARKRAMQQPYKHAAAAKGWTERNLILQTV